MLSAEVRPETRAAESKLPAAGNYALNPKPGAKLA